MLAEMPSGCRAFIDSNIFIYHFLDLSETCTEFLERIKAHEIRGFTSEIVMAEVLHKLMVAEIAPKHEMNRLEVSRLIKRCPSVISKLERCETQDHDSRPKCP
jgi:predicted nucleic acid-binding protein